MAKKKTKQTAADPGPYDDMMPLENVPVSDTPAPTRKRARLSTQERYARQAAVERKQLEAKKEQLVANGLRVLDLQAEHRRLSLEIEQHETMLHVLERGMQETGPTGTEEK